MTVSSKDDEKTSELTVPTADNTVDDIVKSPVEGEETVSDDEEEDLEEILDIN